MAKSIPTSVVILTYNEELNIERCLDSVVWCNDVVVLDSYSTDNTQEIARAKGARVLSRKFDDYATQRNYALDEIKFKYPWVLMLDADDVVPLCLADELENVLKDPGDKVTMYRFRRKDIFLGTWLRHSTNYSSLWFGRVMRVGHVWVERAVNEEYRTEGAIGRLESAVIHFPFSKGISAWIEKHNKYSSMEAELVFHNRISKWKYVDLVNNDTVVRRKTLKAMMFSLPGRPVLLFFARYFVGRGFLDGRAGLTFCILKTFYEYMIDSKVRELKFRSRNTSNVNS